MISLFRHWLANASIARRRREALETFSHLTDAQLRDIGLERFEIEGHVREVLPWRVRQDESTPAFQPSLQGCG